MLKKWIEWNATIYSNRQLQRLHHRCPLMRSNSSSVNSNAQCSSVWRMTGLTEASSHRLLALQGDAREGRGRGLVSQWVNARASMRHCYCTAADAASAGPTPKPPPTDLMILFASARIHRPLSPTTPIQRLIWRASSSVRRPAAAAQRQQGQCCLKTG
jgi:hypothetical protein